MNTIITRGTGFIGSWLIQELIRHGHKVTVIARKRDGLIEEIRNSRQCSIIEKPVEDLRAEDFDGDISYDVCFHLGWGAVSPEKKNNIDFSTEQYFHVNKSVGSMQRNRM